MKETTNFFHLETCVQCEKCGFLYDDPSSDCPRCRYEGEGLNPVPGVSCESCGGPLFEGFGCVNLECANKRRAAAIEKAKDMPQDEIPF